MSDASCGLPNGDARRRVRAEVVARYVFNFRIAPQLAVAMLPDWLVPDLRDGAAVLSYCPYLLRRLCLPGQPASLGFSTICSAARVTARDGDDCRVAWVPSRQATSRAVARGARWHLGTQRFERVHAKFPNAIGSGQFEIAWVTSEQTFAARVTPCAASGSAVFATTDDFVQYFTCESAWSPAAIPGRVTRIDLAARGTRYAPLNVTELDWSWPRQVADVAFDSAFVGTGGDYCWTSDSACAADSRAVAALASVAVHSTPHALSPGQLSFSSIVTLTGY